jgi:hypothetical protein
VEFIIKIEHAGYTFDVPEQIIQQGKIYFEYPNYTFSSQETKKWLKMENKNSSKFIVKLTKSNEDENIILYHLYKS